MQELNQEFEKMSEGLKKMLDKTLEEIKNCPDKKDEILSMWKKHLVNFKKYLITACEQNNSRDIFKAITKAIMFGK